MNVLIPPYNSWEAKIGGIPNTILGRSLRVEDRDLYGKLERLFETWNRVAHRGEVPTRVLAVRGSRSACYPNLARPGTWRRCWESDRACDQAFGCGRWRI
jgi:hypothetical protein